MPLPSSDAPGTDVLVAPKVRIGDDKKLLLALGAAVFMINLDSRIVAPLLPTMADALHVSIARAGWLVSAYTLPYGLLQLAYGPLADRFGKITVCAHAMAAFSIGTACCAVWPSFGAMLTLRALTGAAAAGLIPLTLAYIGDTVPYDERQSTIAALMASAGAAQAFSTGAGGTIAALFSWRAVFPCLGVLAGAATVPLYLFRSSQTRVPTGTKRLQYLPVLRAKRMRPLLGLVFAEGFLYFGGFSFISGLLADRFGLTAFPIGLILAGTGLAAMTTARLMKHLLRRFHTRTLLGAGGGALSLGYLTCAVAPHWSVVFVGCCLVGTGFILCHTNLQTRATEIFPSARGTAVALFAFSLFLGSGIGAVVIGATSSVLGFGYTFALCGTLLAVFAVLVVAIFGRTQPSAPGA
ncbi:MAG TPA: MFS transporter [Polyangiaceae bacterium]|nr:MFS transporter [Polyangiaceae bacterium]